MSQQTLELPAIDDSILARLPPQEQQIVVLKENVRKIAMLLEASGVKEEEIIVDFQNARRREMTQRTNEWQMNTIDPDALHQYVDERIKELYDRKLAVLEGVSLQQLLSVNPYLLRSQNIGTAGKIITTLLDGYVSTVEKDFFEGFLKELVVWCVQQTGSNHTSAQPVISEFQNLYADVIEQIGYSVQKYNGQFMIEHSKLVNRLTLRFSQEFCNPSGAINWRKLVEHNSGNFDLDTL